MSAPVNKYRVIKDVPFQFVQMNLKKGMICEYVKDKKKRKKYEDKYCVDLGNLNVGYIARKIIEGWPEYFEPVIETADSGQAGMTTKKEDEKR